MELMPRITRAQAMDVLSSQSNLAGYKSVLDAAEYFNRAFPMMMTAAGTVPPARVFIMGVGVAGLQAIATARRLGAIVSATDVRAATKEQVQSLGATFVMVEDEESKAAETSGGYAKEMSEWTKETGRADCRNHRQAGHCYDNRPDPRTQGPNPRNGGHGQNDEARIGDCRSGGRAGRKLRTFSEAGQVVVIHGVSIVGHHNVPSRLAANASALYAKNLQNLLASMIDKDGNLAINWDDEIIKGIALTRDGAVIHPNFTKKEERHAT